MNGGLGTGQQDTFSVDGEAAAVQVAAQGILQQGHWHQQNGGHGVCLTFAQVQTFLQLLKAVLPLTVIFPVKAGRIVKRVCPVDENMADFMGKNKPPAAVLGGTL